MNHVKRRSLVLALASVVTLACSRSPQPAGPQPPQAPAPLTIIYNAEEIPTEKSATSQVLQAQLEAKGIPVKLEPLSNASYNDRVGKGEFQAALTLWYLDYDDPEGFLTDFSSKAGYRLARYSRPEFDRVYLEGLFAPTPQQKLAGFRRAQDILLADLPWIPLFSNTEVFLLQPGMEGFKSNAYQYYDYRDVSRREIRAATDVEVQTLDPALVYDLGSKHLVTQSYEGLVAMDERNAVVPALADSWTLSPDAKRLEFRLRKGVRFHPAAGAAARTLSSADVKASFERMLKTSSPYTYIFDHVVGVEEFRKGTAKDVKGFVAKSPLVFTIELVKPFPTMLQWLLAPAAYVLPAGTPADQDLKRSIGTGPFVMEIWDGVVARFHRNPQYWRAPARGVPADGTLEIRVVKDANTALTAFKQGQLDVLNVPLAAFPSVFGLDGKAAADWRGYELRERPLNNLKLIAFNMERAPWGTDAALRRRVRDAIDRDTIVRQLLRGKGRPASTVIPSGVAGF
jgi:ABC-type transport system substrate-binding protein